ncbi:MAG: hypothetical protein IT286_02085 [Proteobacteria bacterium]|jgi:hypothetical protein|nr:hypothetical protein [Pseudomonadota bacterium]
MSDSQKLAQVIQTMTSALESVKGEGLSIADMMKEFSLAIDAYKQYSAHFSAETMDVKEVRVENGKLIEVEYKWQDM